MGLRAYIESTFERLQFNNQGEIPETCWNTGTYLSDRVFSMVAATSDHGSGPHDQNGSQFASRGTKK